MIGVRLSLLFPGNEASMAGKMSDVYLKRRYPQTNSLPYVTGFTPKETGPIKCLPGTWHHVRLRGFVAPFTESLNSSWQSKCEPERLGTKVRPQ